MNVVVVTPRVGELLDMALVKQHLAVEHDDHDAMIAAYVAATAAWLDGPAGWLGLALGPQTLRLDRVGFGGAAGFELPCGPVSDIDSLEWTDGAGVATEVEASLYELVEGTNRVRLAAGEAWPSAGCPVSVTYQTGYAANALPAGIKAAMLLHIEILYTRPDDKRLAALERSRDDLLNPVRRWRV